MTLDCGHCPLRLPCTDDAARKRAKRGACVKFSEVKP